MKRLTLILLALAASATLLTACGNDTLAVIPESPAVSDESETPLASETEAPLPAGLVVVANGEAKFTIIRPEKATEGELELMKSLRSFIEEKTGVTLEMKDDWIKKGQEHDTSAYEILIGNTNYNETAAVKENVKAKNMVAEVQGNKIVFLSGTELGYYTLADALETMFAPHCSGQSLVIPTDFRYTETYGERLAGLPEYSGDYDNMQFVDCGDDNTMLHITGTTADDFAAYCRDLEANGFTLYATHEAAGNSYATYTDDDQIVNLYRYAATGETRIIEEPTSPLPPRAEDAKDYETVCTPALRMVGQEYFRKESDSAPQVGGLCLIYRLSDGKLLVVDGGMDFDTKKNVLLDALKEMSPDPEKITVAAWILTHGHTDHAEAFLKLAKNNGFLRNNITVEALIYNFAPHGDYMVPQKDGFLDDSELIDEVRALPLPGTKIIKAHPGQMYHYADASIEILYTFEDYYPNDYVTNNAASLILRVTLADQTFLILGDASLRNVPLVVKNYGEYLHSDFVQLAHHGYDGGTVELYNNIRADVVLWPTGTYELYKITEKDYNKAALKYAKDLYIAGRFQHTFELPYTPIGNKDDALVNQVKENNALIKQELKDRRH